MLTFSVTPAQELVRGPRVVGGVPTRLILPHVQAQHASPVREYGQYLPCSWSRGPSYFVENQTISSLVATRGFSPIYITEPHAHG